jgi:hypothetical protein
VLFSPNGRRSNNIDHNAPRNRKNKLSPTYHGSIYRGSTYHGSNDGSIYHGSNDGSIYHGCNDGSIYHGSNDGSIYHGSNDGSIYHGSNDGSIYHGSIYHGSTSAQRPNRSDSNLRACRGIPECSSCICATTAQSRRTRCSRRYAAPARTT